MQFTTMHIKHYLTVLCVILLLVAFAVCTFVFTRSHYTHAAPAPTSVNSYGTANGCPSNRAVSHTTTPNVTVNPQQSNSTIMAHTGDIIQFQFPFGQRWSGPTSSQGNLQLQQPAGYAVRASKICVWRFIAKGTGVTHLNFYSQALCKFGQLCPLYFMDLPFTVDVI